jgi:hypothetical protein
VRSDRWGGGGLLAEGSGGSPAGMRPSRGENWLREFSRVFHFKFQMGIIEFD